MSRKATTGAIFLTIFLDLVGFGIVMPFLALQAREIFLASEWLAALLGASYSLAQFFFVPVWGRLSDRIGRRPVLLISVFFSFVTMTALGAALAWSSSIALLFAARIFGGIATANLGTASAYIADITTPAERVKGMGLIGMAFGLGFIVGPGIGGILAEYTVNGREGPMACFVAGLLSLVNFIWVMRGVPESLPAENRDRDNSRSLSPLRLDALAELRRRPAISRAVLANFCIILAFSGMEITYAFYARDKFHLTQAGVGWLFVFMGVTGALTQGGLIRRIGHKVADTSLIQSGLILQVLAFAGIWLAPALGLWMMVTASAVLALGNGLTQPGISGYISRRSGVQEQGASLSANQSLASLARVFGPALGGLLYSSINPGAPFASGVVINLIALGLALLLVKQASDPAAASPGPG